MSKILKFDDLPNELIIYLFDYLEPAESFQSFFDYNDRLRKLVKLYVKYNRRALDKDFERFSTLHSEQPRYDFDPRVSDSVGIHWHFWMKGDWSLVDKRVEGVIKKYPIKLNPSIHPGVFYRLSDQIGPDFVRQCYPEQFQHFEATLFQKSFNTFSEALKFNKNDVELLIEYIKKNEPTRLRNNIRQAANSIWKELQAIEDVNILEIKQP